MKAIEALVRVLLIATCAQVWALASQPNIVLIVADDLGFSDLGCYGGEIATPHLDRLASEGLRMTQFYNSAVCNPSRAGILTGLFPRYPKGGLLAQSVLLRDDMVTLAEVLRAAGYATAMTGKFVRWPGKIAAGSKSDAVAHVVDLMPTFAEVAGVAYPSVRGVHKVPPMEGASLVPAWRGTAAPERDIGWYAYGSRGFRSGKWKVVWGVTGKKWELYDMQSDRTETRDLAGRHPEILQRLVAGWTDWAKRTELPAE